MKQKKKTKRKFNFPAWSFAITTAIIAHLIVLVSFEPLKKKPPKKKETSKQVTLLTMGSKDKMKEDKQIAELFYDKKPSLIVKPNNNYSYSKYLTLNSKLNIIKNKNKINIPADIFKEKITFSTISDKRKEKNNFSLLNIKNLYSIKNIKASPVLPDFPLSPKKDKRISFITPYIISYYKNEVLPVDFQNIKKIKKCLKKSYPNNPTTLDIEFPQNPNLFPHVELVDSCGNQNLDKIAVNVIEQLPLNKNYPEKFNSYLGKNLLVYVQWVKTDKKGN